MIQHYLVFLIFAIATVYVARILIKPLLPGKKGGCGEDCHCSFEPGKKKARA